MTTFIALLLASLVRADEPQQYRDPEITPAERSHWSFVPPKRPAVPNVKSPNAVRNPIDNFIVAKLEAAGLTPSPTTDKRTLIRRVTYDLTGLPPTPKEIDDFLGDNSARAYETLIDRLLASPAYGERWATHWLDVVRFAETNGYELDGDRPQAWRYRDWVIRSLNADVPYDRFVREQIAGDILAAGQDPKKVPDLWHATGLHRCGQVHVVSGNLDSETGRQEVLTEMVTGVGSAVLGLTVACARCHDHKFDPISLGDYYRFQAFFANTFFRDVDLGKDEEKEALQRQLLQASIKLSPVKKQIAEIEAPYRAKLAVSKKAKLDPATRTAVDTPADKRTPEQKKLAAGAGVILKITWDEVLEILSAEDTAKRTALKNEQDRLEAELPELPPQSWAVADDKSPVATHVLKRGDVRKKSGVVKPEFLRVLGDSDGKPKTRLDLANWLTRPEHPLTARVIVNRIWLHHFGRGIVNTPNDFGTRGDAPSHPELLDWLATEFAATGWSMKKLHRLMVTSATYRQTTTGALSPKDPDNHMLGRMNRRRLEAEAIRDAVLTAAGTLTPQVGGTSVRVPLEPEIYDLIFTEGEPTGLWRVTPDPKQHTRRSIYLFLKRNVRLPMFEAFDQPDTLNSCAARPVSTFAPQALIMMNGPFAQEQSKRLAADVLSKHPDQAGRVNELFLRTLGRFATAEELVDCREFLARQTEELRVRVLARRSIAPPADLPIGIDPAQGRAFADLCLVMFNVNEFVYIP